MLIHATLINQNGKNYVHVNDTEFYFQNLAHTYHYITINKKVDFLYFAYVTLCASTLEAALNNIIFSFYINEFGPTDYKKYADSLINIGFSNKLSTTPTIVSKSKYHFNSNSSTIKTLEELITLRNRILHKKPELHESKYETIIEGQELEFEYTDRIQLITKNQCDNFNKAILIFKNEFMIPFFENRLIETDLMCLTSK